MQIKKEIESIYLGKEHITSIFFTILSSNNSYTNYLQTTAENIENQMEEFQR